MKWPAFLVLLASQVLAAASAPVVSIDSDRVGNAADTSAYRSVAYNDRIGAFEVTSSEYSEFARFAWWRDGSTRRQLELTQ